MNSLDHLPIESVIKLNKFKPRPYQYPICEALEVKKIKKIIVVLPRRARQGYSCL